MCLWILLRDITCCTPAWLWFLINTHLTIFVPGALSLAQLQTMLLCSWSGVRWSLQVSYLSHRRRTPSRDPYPEQGRGPVPVQNICFLDRSAHLVTFNFCLFIALNSTFHFSLQIVPFGTPASTDTNLPETRSLLWRRTNSIQKER